jgi:hypothetical protein
MKIAVRPDFGALPPEEITRQLGSDLGGKFIMAANKGSAFDNSVNALKPGKPVPLKMEAQYASLADLQSRVHAYTPTHDEEGEELQELLVEAAQYGRKGRVLIEELDDVYHGRQVGQMDAKVFGLFVQEHIEKPYRESLARWKHKPGWGDNDLPDSLDVELDFGGTEKNPKHTYGAEQELIEIARNAAKNGDLTYNQLREEMSTNPAFTALQRKNADIFVSRLEQWDHTGRWSYPESAVNAAGILKQPTR